MRCSPKLKSKNAKCKIAEAVVSGWCMINFAFFILHFALAATLVGCAQFRAEPVQEATAEQLAGLLRQREAEIQSMKGLFQAQISGLGLPIAQRVEGSVLFRRPNTYRLQGFDRMGGPLFDLVRGADSYSLRLRGKVYNGRLEDLGRAERMGAPLRLSLWAMSGLVGTEAFSKDDSLLLQEDGEWYRLDVLGPGEGGASRRLWFDRRSLQVIREDRFLPTGQLEATMQFEDFRPVEEMPTGQAATEVTSNGPPASAGREPGKMVKPFVITIQDGQGRGTLRLTFHEIVPNPRLEPTDLGIDAGRVSGYPGPERDRHAAVGR